MICGAGCSTPKSNNQAADVTQALDSLFEQRYDDENAPGGAVVIARGDSIIYERYFGVADMQSGESVSDSTLFNIASVSKQFTVAGLMRLGVDMQRPVSDFFDFPQQFWRTVTLADLVSHTSGVPDSRDRSDRDKCIYATDESSEQYFPCVDSLKFAPGSAYDYLNPSFILLARVIERETGTEFTEYMREQIFRPQGMESTVYFSPSGMPEHTAHGYAPVGNGDWEEYDYGEETFLQLVPMAASTALRAICCDGRMAWSRGKCWMRPCSTVRMRLASASPTVNGATTSSVPTPGMARVGL